MLPAPPGRLNVDDFHLFGCGLKIDNSMMVGIDGLAYSDI